MLFSKIVSLVPLLGSLASANSQYKSRPDLAPLVLNITVPATDDTADGLLFFNPSSTFPPVTNHGPAQEAPYIFTDKGELVWSGFGYAAPGAENFRVQKFKGEDVLSIFEGSHNSPMGHGHGHTTIFNNRYQAIQRVQGAGHRLADQHEFLIFNDTEAIFSIFEPEYHDLSAYGGREDQSWIINNRLQKVDVETNNLLWEWSSLDHVDPADSNVTLQDGQGGTGVNSSQAWHYFYMNAADVNPSENTLLFSARFMCTIFKVDGETGEVIWRLGGDKSNFTLGEGVEFCWQHDTRFHQSFQGHESKGSKEIISFFDNAAHTDVDENKDPLTIRPYSEGKVVEVDTEKKTATLLASFRAPGDLSAQSQGNTQILDNDNALVNWGFKGDVSEHRPDGTPIFFAHFGSGELGEGVQNYRAYKFNWHGYPTEDPAVVAFSNDDGDGVTVYVSWNGDTETKVWRFFDENHNYLGESKRTGFETKFDSDKNAQSIIAEAYNSEGNQLVASQLIETTQFKPPLKFTPQ